MKKLVKYLNALPRVDQDFFASLCKTSVGYLRKACSVGSPLAPATCVLIERHSLGEVTRRDMRPDDWQDIWPELADSETKHPAALANQAQGATEIVSNGVAHA